jgi:hypothetical protein
MEVVSLTFNGVPLLSSLQVEAFAAAAGAALAGAFLVSAGACANAKEANNDAQKTAVLEIVF